MENKKDFQNHIIIFLLAVIIVLLLSRGGEGRYAISDGLVLDTKTSELWVHGAEEIIYCGTNENPKFQRISVTKD